MPQNTYQITAWCDRTFTTSFHVEAESPEQALELARSKVHDEPAEECDNGYDWDRFRVCDAEDNERLTFPPIAIARDSSPGADEAAEPRGEAVPELLDALAISEGIVQWAFDHGADPEATAAALKYMRAVIARAHSACPSSSLDIAGRRSLFEMEQKPQKSFDRAWVKVDGRFDVAIIRTNEGIVIDVYPKEWDNPIDTMTVWDEQVTEIETQFQEP